MDEGFDSLEEAVKRSRTMHFNRKNNNGNGRGFMKKNSRKLASFGLNMINSKDKTLTDKVLKEAGITLFSAFYAGNLPGKYQLKWENKLNLQRGKLTRVSSTGGFAIFLGLEYLGVFKFIEPIVDSIPYIKDVQGINSGLDIGFLSHTGLTFGFNSIRYGLARLKKTPVPAISWYSALVNSGHLLGKGAKYTYKRLKEPIKSKFIEINKDYRELMDLD